MILITISTGNAVILIYYPLSCAPNYAIPGLIRVVFHERVEVVGFANGQELNVMVELELILICHLLHNFFDVPIFSTEWVALIRYVNNIFKYNTQH
jgi:hypothetical protein